MTELESFVIWLRTTHLKYDKSKANHDNRTRVRVYTIKDESLKSLNDFPHYAEWRFDSDGMFTDFTTGKIEQKHPKPVALDRTNSSSSSSKTE